MSGLAPLVRPLAVVAAFLVAGVLSGVLWEWVWSPPVGVVVRGEWVLEPLRPDLAFSATGTYVVVAALVGAVLGAAIGWAFPGREAATLAGVLVGSLLAGWLMSQVGHALGPEDPRALAAGSEGPTALPSDLRAAPSALSVFPAAALLGLAGAYLSGAGHPPRAHRIGD